MKGLHSYPKVWNLGHPAIADLFSGSVVVQEKVDGSQFSFGIVNGALRCRSKGAELHVGGTDKLFAGAVATAVALADAGRLVEGWTYRGEALWRPKHNALSYARAPHKNVILFDVDTGTELRLSPGLLDEVGEHLALEVVPTLYVGEIADAATLAAFLERESCLGGAKIEGIVIKNYARWGEDGKMLMGKLVSEAFKEVHRKEWPKANPGRADIIEQVKDRYRSERRWEKAIQHRAENGALENDPRDIGPLLKEIEADVREECKAEIASILFDAFWPEIKRGLTAGFPQWYKDRLAARQFASAEEPAP